MAIHSSILVWKIPWTEVPAGAPWGPKVREVAKRPTTEHTHCPPPRPLQQTLAHWTTREAWSPLSAYLLDLVLWKFLLL